MFSIINNWSNCLNKILSWVDFGREIIPAAIENSNVQAHLFQDYWEDIGTIRAFYEANLDLASPLPKFNFFNTDAPIYTRSRYLPPSKMHDCDINNSMVSEGCILNGVYAAGSIIGLRSRIDLVLESKIRLLWARIFLKLIKKFKYNEKNNIPHIGIGENSVIRRAIIDKNARIGKNVRLINKDNTEDRDEENFSIRDGIIIIPKNAVIADGTEI